MDLVNNDLTSLSQIGRHWFNRILALDLGKFNSVLRSRPDHAANIGESAMGGQTSINQLRRRKSIAEHRMRRATA